MAKRGRPRKTESGNHPAKDWLQKIEAAKKVKEEWKKRFQVELAYDMYEGVQRPPWVPVSEWVTINLLHPAMEAELATLYSGEPYFFVNVKRAYASDEPTLRGLEQIGKVRQAAINYLAKEDDLKPKARAAIKDAFFQYGVLKIHYETDSVENPTSGEPVPDDDGLPLVGENGEIVYQPDVYVERERYKITRIHPDDFLVDMDAGPLDEDVSWKAQRIRVPVEDVKSNKSYNAARSRVQATEVKEDEQERRARQLGAGASMPKPDPEPDVAVLWEIWDNKNGQWCIVSEGLEDAFLQDPEAVPKGIERDPFADLRFTPRDSSWYPFPPMATRLDSQREYCDARSKLAVHRRRFNRKYEVASQYLEDDSELTKLELGEDGTIIRKTQPGVEVVTPIRDAPVDSNVITEIAFLRKDFDVLATGANQRGSGTGIDSATEAGVIEARTRLREGDRKQLVAELVSEVGRKLDQLLRAYLTEDLAISVAGPEGGEPWKLIGPSIYRDAEKIRAEFDYQIDLGTLTPIVPEVERAQTLALIQTLAGPGLVLMQDEGVANDILKSFGLENRPIAKGIVRIARQMAAQGQLPQQGGSVAGAPVAPNPGASETAGAFGIDNSRGGAQ